MARDFQLSGASALVTGAGSGIGRQVALALAGHGGRVLAADIDGDAAAKTAVACGAVGPEAEGVQCDVGDADAVAALAERVHVERGPLDVLINNAGVGISGRLGDMSVDDWRWIRRVNLDGVVHCCLAFGPAMVERGRGHVVNVASALAYMPHGLEPAYIATKAGVLALSQSLRGDWRPRGVGVSAVCPGMVDTGIAERTRYLGRQADEREKTIAGFRRARSPEVVARDVVRAIREDLTVVPVGWDGRLLWWVHRLLPLRVQQLIARYGVG
ncbi:MAG TPA: SDR family NAD(P)-dependent oxidoreductase [Acidimicrobiales bacterium]